MSNPHFLVVGLGNITHPFTRHSIGHHLIDTLSKRHAIPLSSSRLGHGGSVDIQVGSGLSNPTSVTITLFKPKSLMNISGTPVAQRLRETVRMPTNLIVIHDCLDVKPFKLSYKSGGSAGGHNGVRSIIAALGNDMNFHRLRIGIGRDADPAQFVLGPLSREERDFWGPAGTGSELVWTELVRIVEKTTLTT